MNTDTPETDTSCFGYISPDHAEEAAPAELCRQLERQRDEAHKLLRRLGTPKAFMDLEGVRIICADYMARWREGEVATPKNPPLHAVSAPLQTPAISNVQTVEERLLTMCNYHHKITKDDKDFLAILSEKVEGITIDTSCSAVVPGPPMCALAPWELTLGDARKKVAEYLTEIRKLEDELSLRAEQCDAAESDWNEACDDRNAYYHELTKARLDVERMNWIEKHSTQIFCFENVAGNVERYEVASCRAMIDREISQQNDLVQPPAGDKPKN